MTDKELRQKIQSLVDTNQSLFLELENIKINLKKEIQSDKLDYYRNDRIFDLLVGRYGFYIILIIIIALIY